MPTRSNDSLSCRIPLPGFPTLAHYSLPTLARTYPTIRNWPRVKLIVLENLLRHEGGKTVSKSLIESYLQGDKECAISSFAVFEAPGIIASLNNMAMMR
jgi:hypothetical protein